jgi:sulfur carrier protein
VEVEPSQELTLTSPDRARYAELEPHRQDPTLILRITLNGERVELEQPLSVIALLEKLDIDPRRVAVEHNLTILKRHRFPEVVVGDGDNVEIVNFVGGG